MTSLTDLEREIVELVILGKGNREIAEDLGVALNSIRAYMVPIFTKAQVNNRTELAVRYHRNQVIEELSVKANKHTEGKYLEDPLIDECDGSYYSIGMQVAEWLQSQKDVLP